MRKQGDFLMINKIKELKQKNDICILAHSYQSPEILEVADITGDSYALSVKARDVVQKNILMWGVRFMAESVKVLSRQKRVFLSHSAASCAMADGITREDVLKLKEQYKDYCVVAYINTTTDVKTVCDVCVTSSSAVKIVDRIDNKNILFIPDCNLGAFVAQELPHKNIKLIKGGCPVHMSVSADEVVKAKNTYPNAKLLVHPECIEEVTKMADFAGSTADIMNYATNSDEKEFIIGTENNIIEHLKIMCPQKRFYPLSQGLICADMRLTTLTDVYNCVSGNGGEEIILDDTTINKAKKCIDEMIRLSYE